MVQCFQHLPCTKYCVKDLTQVISFKPGSSPEGGACVSPLEIKKLEVPTVAHTTCGTQSPSLTKVGGEVAGEGTSGVAAGLQ